MMLQVLETLTDEFCANMAALVADRFGTHVGRLLLCIVAGQDVTPKSQNSAVSSLLALPDSLPKIYPDADNKPHCSLPSCCC